MKKNRISFLFAAIFIAMLSVLFCWSCETAADYQSVNLYGTLGNPGSVTVSSQPTTSGVVDPTTTLNATPSDVTTSTSTTTVDPTSAGTGTVQGSAVSASGPCAESGICSMDSVLTYEYEIPITFQYYQKNSVLIMSFLKGDLVKKQPKHVHYFENAKTYKFMTTYSLATPLFSKLGLPHNSRITPEDVCTIMPEKDGKIAMEIKFSHD